MFKKLMWNDKRMVRLASNDFLSTKARCFCWNLENLCEAAQRAIARMRLPLGVSRSLERRLRGVCETPLQQWV